MNTPLVAAGDRSFSDPETLVTLNLFQGQDDVTRQILKQVDFVEPAGARHSSRPALALG